jgi:hypothetical protein
MVLGSLNVPVQNGLQKAYERGASAVNSTILPSAADLPPESIDNVDEAALAEVMRVTPLGAGIVAGTAVALLVAGFLAMYLLVFLPRGTVG